MEKKVSVVSLDGSFPETPQPRSKVVKRRSKIMSQSFAMKTPSKDKLLKLFRQKDLKKNNQKMFSFSSIKDEVLKKESDFDSEIKKWKRRVHLCGSLKDRKMA